MKLVHCTTAAAVSLALFTASVSAQTAPVQTDHAMVVSIQHDATDAGVEILKQGGNAVDAAVAVGFALAVVYPPAGNIGGGGFMLIRPGSTVLNGGKSTFLDYREKAPAAASRDMYLDTAGNVVPKLSTVGVKASGVPGTVAGLAYAEQHFGRLGLARVMAPAIRLARDGFVLPEEQARGLHASLLAQFPESHRIFQRDGNYYKAGDTFKQPDLARTLERIAARPDDFYKGKMAAEVAAFEARSGGLITAADMAAYECKERAPLVGHYRGYEVLTSPPPSSGGIVLLETLNILEGYDLQHLGPGGIASGDRSPEQVHIITEAFRRAYMDRGDFLGDPDFNTMPLAQMASPAYAAAWRKTIDAVKPTASAQLVRPAGFMPAPPSAKAAPHESPQTTHFSVVDSGGNAVSSTYTLNFGFGSGVTVEGMGFLLNDEMDDFASKMGVPNGFGLIQGPANAIAPGKRPLSSMTPTIVSEMPVAAKPGGATHSVKVLAAKPGYTGSPDYNGAGHYDGTLDLPKRKGTTGNIGRLRLVLGSPGGSTIITTVANDLISEIDNGLDIQSAADAPRFHHQYLPDILQFEKSFDVRTIDVLKATGYITKRESEFDEKSPGNWGDSELIAVDPKTGKLQGGQDKRHHFGKAAGY